VKIEQRGNSVSTMVRLKLADGSWLTKRITAPTERKLHQEVRKTQGRAAEGKLTHARGTLGEFLEREYLPSVSRVSKRGRPLSPTTVVKYATAVGHVSRSSIGTTKLSAIRASHVRQLRDELTASGKLAPTTVGDTLRILSQALTVAVAEGLIPTNYASGSMVNRPVGKPAPFTVITPETARTIMGASQGEDPWEAVVALGIGAGLRREEMLALDWPSIDFTAGMVTVARTLTYANGELHLRDETKSEAGHRTIDLPAFAVEALRRHRVAQDVRRLKLGSAWRDMGLVIDKGDGGPWEPTRLSKVWKAWATSRGFGDVRLHGLRHGFATLGLAAGLRAEVMVELMGHSSTRILKRYQDVIPSLKREAADQFDRLLGKAR
jgi:integrase